MRPVFLTIINIVTLLTASSAAADHQPAVELQPLVSIDIGTSRPRAICFSGNGLRVAVAQGHENPIGEGEGQVRVFEIGSGKTLFTSEFKSRPRAVSLDQDGDRVAVAHQGVTIFGVDTGATLGQLRPAAGVVVEDASLHPSGTVVAFVGEVDQTVHVASGDQFSSIRKLPNMSGARSVAFTSDGSKLAAAGAATAQSLQVWSTGDWTPQISEGKFGHVIRFTRHSSDGQWAFLWDGSGTIFESKVGTRRTFGTTAEGLLQMATDGELNAASFVGTDGRLLTVSRVLSLWDTNRMVLLVRIPIQDISAGPAALDSDGRQLATVGRAPLGRVALLIHQVRLKDTNGSPEDLSGTEHKKARTDGPPRP